MMYEVYVVDVHGDWHHHDTNIEASTPNAALRKLLDWCDENNVMPESMEAKTSPNDTKGADDA
ncbi:MAG: hypothetical protein RIB80_04850 [Rhodospirillales bacterium]